MRYGKLINGKIKTWNDKKSIDLPNAIGLSSASDELLEAQEIFPIIIPNYNVLTEKLGDLQLVGNKFTKEIIQLTQQEIDQREADRIAAMPTLAQTYAQEIGISASRPIDLQIDQIEIFKPTEKVYNLFGAPIYKDYFKDDVLVCRLTYEKIKDIRSHKGFESEEFVGTKTTFHFYKNEESTLEETKEKITKQFNLVPTEILENDVVTGVIWSSADREGLLRAERYKSEQVMKSFNPNLYQLFVSIFGDEYIKYKEIGNNTKIIQDLIAYDLPKLDEEVQDDDKAVIFGKVMETYPPLTIRQLLITALP